MHRLPLDLLNKILGYYYNLLYKDVLIDIKSNLTNYRDRYYVQMTSNNQQSTIIDWQYDLKLPPDIGYLLWEEYNSNYTRHGLILLNYCILCYPTPNKKFIKCKKCIPSRF